MKWTLLLPAALSMTAAMNNSILSAQTIDVVGGGDGPDALLAATATNDGGFVACGNWGASGSSVREPWFWRWDVAGNEVWSVTPELGGLTSMFDVVELEDGSLLSVGFFDSPLPLVASVPIAMRLDADGNVLSTVQFPTNPAGRLKRIAATPNGGFTAIGHVATTPDSAIWVQFDGAGEVLGEGRWGMPETDAIADAICTDGQGGWYVAGEAGADLRIWHLDAEMSIQGMGSAALSETAACLDLALAEGSVLVAVEDAFADGPGNRAGIVKFSLDLQTFEQLSLFHDAPSGAATLLPTDDPMQWLLVGKQFDAGTETFSPFVQRFGLQMTWGSAAVSAMVLEDLSVRDAIVYGDQLLVVGHHSPYPDSDGFAKSVSLPLDVHSHGDDLAMPPFPNPTTGFVQVPALSVPWARVALYDSFGRPVFNDIEHILDGVMLDLRSLPTGLYALVVLSESGERSTHWLERIPD